MREHKYRVWDKEKQQMSPVAEISFGDDGSAKTIVVQPAPKGEYSRQLVHGENAVLIEYTGLKDINGVEIYESDVVRITHTALLIPANTIGVVSYASARYVIDTHAHTHGLNMFVDRRFRRYGKPHIEVVGNVWEHPELAPKK